MARNIVVVLMCSVVVFALVWKVAPDFLATALPIVGTVSAHDEIDEVTEPAEPVKKAVSPKSKARIHQAETKAAANAEVRAEVVNSTDETASPATAELAPDYVDPSKPRVLAETAALYSSNGPSGRVLRMLKRNDVLELHFKVDNNDGQEWMFVNVPDQRVSGFLSSDSLR